MSISLAIDGGIDERGRFYPPIRPPRGWKWEYSSDSNTVYAVDLETGMATPFTVKGGFGRQRAALKKAVRHMKAETAKRTKRRGAAIRDERDCRNGVALVKNGRVVKRLGQNVDINSCSNAQLLL